MMLVASLFLACGGGSFPFKFLGVMVADSPRKEVMRKEWQVSFFWWKGGAYQLGPQFYPVMLFVVISGS